MLDRNRRFNVLLTEEELTMLHTLAQQEGLSASDYVRLFIRRAHAEHMDQAPKKGGKPKK